MSSKIVSYDLKTPNGNYESLYAKLKQYDAWAKLTESCWYIKSDDSSATVRDNLRSVMDSNDRLFVASLTGEAAWRNVKCKNQYLKTNL